MSTILPRRIGYICKTCQRSQVTKLATRTITADNSFKRRNVAFGKESIRYLSSTPKYSASTPLKPKETQKNATSVSKASPSQSNPTETLKSLKTDVGQIISRDTVPEELEILELLERFHAFSNVIAFGSTQAPTEMTASQDKQSSATSALLDLDEPESRQDGGSGMKELSLPFREKAANTICELIYDLVRDPKVFISPDILQLYVRIQCLLGGPEYLPEIFHLYANKPIPQPKTNPIQYSNPSPKSPKNAIPQNLSDAALDAAIAKKDLPLALSMIDTTVATPAFRRNKLISKASIPLLAVGSTPLIAYTGAQWLSQYQNVWDPEMAKYTAIAGSIAYIGTLSTIGFVAITTYNDQMERVVWRQGTSLTDRWIREEERLYFDRVAMAWGFQKKYRRGEEQGEEWEALREVIGLRSMVLDKTELMEGME